MNWMVFCPSTLKEKETYSQYVAMSCVSSDDPISNLKENLSFIKNNKLSYEIRDCISSFCNIIPSMASVVLRNSILRKHNGSIWAENANSKCLLQQQPQQQQPQQKPLRSPPYFISSIKKLKPHNQKVDIWTMLNN